MTRLATLRRSRFGVAPFAAILLATSLTACSGDGPGTGDATNGSGDPAPSVAPIGRPGGAGDGTSDQKSGQARFADTPCPTGRKKLAGWERPQVRAWAVLDDCQVLFVGATEQLYLAGLTDDGTVHPLGDLPESQDVPGLIALAATDDAVWIGGAADTGAVAVRLDRATGERTTLKLPGQGVASMARSGADVVALIVDDERSRLVLLTADRKAAEIATVGHPLRFLAVDEDRVVATGGDLERGWAVTGTLSGGRFTATKLGKNLQPRGVALVDGQVVAAFEHLDRNQAPDRSVLYTGSPTAPATWQASRSRRGDDVGALAVTPNGVLATVNRRGVQAVMRLDKEGALDSWRSFRGEESAVTVLGSATATWIVGHNFVRTLASRRT